MIILKDKRDICELEYYDGVVKALVYSEGCWYLQLLAAWDISANRRVYLIKKISSDHANVILQARKLEDVSQRWAQICTAISESWSNSSDDNYLLYTNGQDFDSDWACKKFGTYFVKIDDLIDTQKIADLGEDNALFKA